MRSVIVASENPVKIEVAKRAFAAIFPDEQFRFVGIKSKSGVAEQPMEEETRRGAENRLRYIMEHHPDADFYISQEGGLCRENDRMFERAWILVTDQSGFIGNHQPRNFICPSN